MLLLLSSLILSATSLQPQVTTRQVEFELFEGGYMTLDVELPADSGPINIFATEYDEEGHEVNNESRWVGPTPMPTQSKVGDDPSNIFPFSLTAPFITTPRPVSKSARVFYSKDFIVAVLCYYCTK